MQALASRKQKQGQNFIYLIGKGEFESRHILVIFTICVFWIIFGTKSFIVDRTQGCIFLTNEMKFCFASYIWKSYAGRSADANEIADTQV